MHLRPGEVVMLRVKRHLTPYVLKLLFVAAMAVPLYGVLFFIWDNSSSELLLILFAIISFVLGAIATLISIDYLLDKLVVTNKRVVWINWKGVFNKHESETELHDIQDIETTDKGLLSKLSLLDYGTLQIETAATTTTIIFTDCKYPHEVKLSILKEVERVREKAHRT